MAATTSTDPQLGSVKASSIQRIAIILGVLCAGAVVYALGLVVYRLYFHPLARFPGPILNAISDIPGAIWTLQGRLPMKTRKIHEKYGPVIRLSPNELAFTSVAAWQDIYGHRNGRQDLNKDPIHVGSVDPMPGVSTISMADHANHARQRKALSHGFSKKALWEQEGIVQEFVDKLMSRFHEFAKRGETFDIVKWYNFITFDVIGELSFGESFGCLERGDFHFWITLIFDAVKAGAIQQATRRVATAGSTTQAWLMKFIPSELSKRRADHLSYSREKVMRRLQDTKSERKDFMYYILKQGETYDLSQDEVIVNAALFIVAGSETTASTLASLTANLIRHPEVYNKLKSEIRTRFASENEINLLAVNEDLPYLNACIEEGLRTFPPAPIGFLRTIQKGGDTIDGMFIPGGTAVSVSSWCAHHSPLNFTNPDDFIPERWLPNSGYETDQKLAHRPFSLGPRGCIGKDLSYVEMRLILARTIFNFDLVNADSAKDWDPEGDMKHMKAFSTWQKPGLNVTATVVKR